MLVICYADGMIEFSQPAQCLFCPQRRKIALLMKLVLAGSAAIITAMILFQPGSKQVTTPRGAKSFQGTVPASNTSVQVLAEARHVESAGASEAVSRKAAEILAQARERFQEVQAEMRPLLSEAIPPASKAQKLLDN